MFEIVLMEAAQEAGLFLSPLQRQSFVRYYQLLLAGNKRVNLTAITDPQEVAVKHVVDSLLCYDAQIFFPGAKVIDVGSGAGFPGIPLKIVYPDLVMTLLEAQQKRVQFLTSLVQELALTSVTVVHDRAETAARREVHRDQYHVAVSRAVAPLNVLVELCLPFVRPGGFCVALKGAKYEEELAEAAQAIKLLGGTVWAVKKTALPGLEDRRAVIYLQKTGPTPERFPRRPGMAAKRPLRQ